MADVAGCGDGIQMGACPCSRFLCVEEAMCRFTGVMAAALLIAACGSPARGETIHVPGDAMYLVGAFHQASSGDTILVAPGYYSGSGFRGLDFAGKDLTLLSEGGSAVTTIDCEGYTFAFYIFDGEHAVIEGFTVTNASNPHGGAMTLCNGAVVEIRDCRFADCSAQAGGVAAVLLDSSIRFEDCVFESNTATTRGGVLDQILTEARLERCHFYGNSAPEGGVFMSIGTHMIESGPVYVTDCTFSGNSAESGTVFQSTLWGAQFYADHCYFKGNVADCGPG
jgi:hypothetical protein